MKGAQKVSWTRMNGWCGWRSIFLGGNTQKEIYFVSPSLNKVKDPSYPQMKHSYSHTERASLLTNTDGAFVGCSGLAPVAVHIPRVHVAVDVKHRSDLEFESLQQGDNLRVVVVVTKTQFDQKKFFWTQVRNITDFFLHFNPFLFPKMCSKSWQAFQTSFDNWHVHNTFVTFCEKSIFGTSRW